MICRMLAVGAELYWKGETGSVGEMRWKGVAIRPQPYERLCWTTYAFV
jgi:hypothetical protein